MPAAWRDNPPGRHTISVQAPDGNNYPLVDGGFTDWTARLLGNQKERLLISGIGSEFVCKTYRRS